MHDSSDALIFLKSHLPPVCMCPVNARTHLIDKTDRKHCSCSCGMSPCMQRNCAPLDPNGMDTCTVVQIKATCHPGSRTHQILAGYFDGSRERAVREILLDKAALADYDGAVPVVFMPRSLCAMQS